MARVCLIDDDIFVRDALSLGLEDAGYQVLTAPGAAAGFDVIRRETLDAVITDMNMPGTGGDQLIKEVRAAWPELPIIAISGTGVIDGRNTADVARELGANATLIKPFRARALAAALEQVLGAAPA
jgi:DNA-binding response OmpR family regulator